MRSHEAYVLVPSHCSSDEGCFFFSSRRRHTRSLCDWSSDVCSSDLGVIVAYEDNMFKVKTEFGYELIEKDKIESIIPLTPTGKTETPSGAKKSATPPPSKTEGGAPATDSQPQVEPTVATSTAASGTATNGNAKTVNPGPAGKTDKASPKKTKASLKPETTTNPGTAHLAAPATKGSPAGEAK